MIGVSYRYIGGHTMREGNKFSIENDSGLWRKKVGAMLGVVASAALAISGCGAPISETAPTAATEGSTIIPELDSANECNLDWQIVDRVCVDGPDCKYGAASEISSVRKACYGTTLLYKHYNHNGQSGITAISNSPECTASSAPESSPAPAATATPTPVG